MTNKGALAAALEPLEASDSKIEKYLLDAGIIAEGEYLATKEEIKQIDLVAINVLQDMMSVSSVSEGGYSKTIDVEGIKARLLSLANKHNISLPGITKGIRAVNLW